MKNHECDKIFGDVCMIEDTDKEDSKIAQELIIDLYMKSEKVLKKLRRQVKRQKFRSLLEMYQNFIIWGINQLIVNYLNCM